MLQTHLREGDPPPRGVAITKEHGPEAPAGQRLHLEGLGLERGRQHVGEELHDDGQQELHERHHDEDQEGHQAEEVGADAEELQEPWGQRSRMGSEVTVHPAQGAPGHRDL